MSIFIAVAGVFAFIAFIAATSVYKRRESWVAFCVFGGLALLGAIAHFWLRVL